MTRLGLTLAPTHQLRLEGLLRLVQRAEAVGFDSVWVPETWGADAVSVLTVLARETRTIRLASGVFNVYSRSAMLLAQTAATLQELSGGRFILGLGVSGPVVIENWHGVPYGRPVSRTRQYVEAICLALDGRRVDYDGDELHLRGFKLQNPPEQKVPIFIASLGPRNVELTGELADGWLPIFAARGHMRPLFEALRVGAARSAREAISLEVGAYLPTMLGPRAELLLRQQIAYYVGGMGTFYADMLRRIGFQDDVTRIRDAWNAGDRVTAVRSVSTSILDACTISGDPTIARNRLAQYRAEGITIPILAPPHGATEEEAIATIDALAP